MCSSTAASRCRISPSRGSRRIRSITAGTRTITVESSANPGATLLTITPNLVPATDNSIALAGTAGAMTALVLADSNPLIVAGRAQLRVVNISPDFAAVDVYANFGKIVSGLGPNAASAYSLVDAASAGTGLPLRLQQRGHHDGRPQRNGAHPRERARLHDLSSRLGRHAAGRADPGPLTVRRTRHFGELHASHTRTRCHGLPRRRRARRLRAQSERHRHGHHAARGQPDARHNRRDRDGRRHDLHDGGAFRKLHRIRRDHGRQLHVQRETRRQRDAGLYGDRVGRQRLGLHVHRLRAVDAPRRDAAHRHAAGPHPVGQLRISPRQRLADRRA